MTAGATSADLEALDRLGLVLCRLGGECVSLAWDGVGYDVVWTDEAGFYFSGHGPSPSAAVAAAKRWAEMKRAERARALAHA